MAMMKTRRDFEKLFSSNKLPLTSHRIKSAILALVVIVALIFIIYEDSIVSTHHHRLHFSAAAAAQKAVRISDSKLQFANKLLLSVRELTETGSGNSSKPPFNVTRESSKTDVLSGRDSMRLPELDVLEPDNLTERFHGRVLEFFRPDCELRAFMTWISPADLFGRREVMGMETFFKAHPNGCLIILSRTLDSPAGYRVLKPVQERGLKVAAVAPDLAFLFRDTPAEAWFDQMKSGSKDPGEIPFAQNLSNLMRLVVLYKYGGVYLDTDFIILKSLKGLKNSIGAQSVDLVSGNWTRLNNAVLIFDMNHPLVFKFIEEFAATFNGNKWGHNGPYLVSRVVRRIETRPGFNFRILPPAAFYPVNWNRIGGLFKKPRNQRHSRWVNAKLLQLSGIDTYGVHLWNKQSNRIAIEEGSVMGRIISEHCVICDRILSAQTDETSASS